MSQTKFSLFIASSVEKSRSTPWTDGNNRRFGAFFVPDDPSASPLLSLQAAELGRTVSSWRANAKLAGWNVAGWEHVKGLAA